MEHWWNSCQDWIWESNVHSKWAMAFQITPLCRSNWVASIWDPISFVLCTCLDELWSHVCSLPRFQKQEQIVQKLQELSCTQSNRKKRLASIFNVSLLISLTGECYHKHFQTTCGHMECFHRTTQAAPTNTSLKTGYGKRACRKANFSTSMAINKKRQKQFSQK